MMLAEPLDERNATPAEQLGALGDEFVLTLHALASGALETLEESLWKQQVLCANLQRFVEQHSSQGAMDLAALKFAAGRLASPQKQLAGVLEQASICAEALHRLCAAYQDHQTVVPQTSVLI